MSRGGSWPDIHPGTRLSVQADFSLQDLAGRTFGESIHDPYGTRALVRCYLALGVFAQLILGGGLPGLERHDGGDLFAERLVRHADDRGLGDRGVLVQHLLDLPRVDVVTAADDHVLLAVHDEEEAVF